MDASAKPFWHKTDGQSNQQGRDFLPWHCFRPVGRLIDTMGSRSWPTLPTVLTGRNKSRWPAWRKSCVRRVRVRERMRRWRLGFPWQQILTPFSTVMDADVLRESNSSPSRVAQLVYVYKDDSGRYWCAHQYVAVKHWIINKLVEYSSRWFRLQIRSEHWRQFGGSQFGLAKRMGHFDRKLHGHQRCRPPESHLRPASPLRHFQGQFSADAEPVLGPVGERRAHSSSHANAR